MKCMKKYADGGVGPKRKPKGTAKGKLDPKCKGPKACYDGGEPDHGKTRGPNKAEVGSLSSKPQLDRSRFVSQKEIERNRKKKETAGMGVAERVRYNMNKRKKQKATKEATQLNRYAGPRFL